MQQFIADYETEYGVPPETAFAALAYDAVMLIASAIERADSAKQKDIAGALERTGDFPGVTGSISFAPGVHIPDKEVTIVHIVGDERTLAAIIQPQGVPAP
jgi:branched-chain amino acid transport system substrate-binding protein